MLWSELENLIGYKFNDIQLLETAMTHASYANDFLGDPYLGNERLEFLGDALLDAVVGEKLYRRFYDDDEGRLTKLRADIVCERSLSNASIALGLNMYLRLGKGEETRGGRDKPSIVADNVEALIAAVYLDCERSQALDVLDRLVDRVLGQTIEMAVEGKLPGDEKTRLQERCQVNGSVDIRYVIVAESGPDHDKLFTSAVLIEGVEAGRGEGRTKKEAEAAAAHAALRCMEE